jgi:23S rRNA pseudouridine955/2504/2580 synthase
VTLGPNDDGRRLDRVLRKVLPDIPLSRIYRALRSREIAVNGKRVRGDTRVYEGDVLEIAETLHSARIKQGDNDASQRTGPRINRANPSTGTEKGRFADSATELASRVVFRSDDLLVISKMRGELTHGPSSLEDGVRDYLRGKLAGGVSYRPGPVHRLDRNTSGLVIFGVSLKGARAATDAIRTGEIIKRYVALFEGRIDAGVRWEDDLKRDTGTRVTGAAGDGATGGDDAPARTRGTGSAKHAVTHVEPLAATNRATVALVRIDTGRTHQIRAQAQLHGHPLLGDRKYGSDARGPYHLHAGALTATDSARTNLGFSHIWTDLPSSLRDRIVDLFGGEAADRVARALRSPPD